MKTDINRTPYHCEKGSFLKAPWIQISKLLQELSNTLHQQCIRNTRGEGISNGVRTENIVDWQGLYSSVFSSVGFILRALSCPAVVCVCVWGGSIFSHCHLLWCLNSSCVQVSTSGPKPCHLTTSSAAITTWMQGYWQRGIFQVLMQIVRAAALHSCRLSGVANPAQITANALGHTASGTFLAQCGSRIHLTL